MKVLHVIPAVAERYGGPSQAIVEMTRALLNRHVDVLIATTDADGAGHLSVPLGQPVCHDGVPTVFFARQWSESLKYSRPLQGWLAAHVAEYDLVHIHAVFSHACLAAASACRSHGVPYLVRPLGSLDPWSMRQKPLRKRLLWYAGARRMVAGAAAIHYTTLAEQRLAEDSLGLRRGVVVPLGVSSAMLEETPVDHFVAPPAPIPANEPYVLVLSRLHPKKGLEALIDSFATVTERPGLNAWRLVIAGDGEPAYAESLRRQAQARLASERIIFSGWLTGKSKLSALRRARLLALASHQENFGIAAVEALACGVPVLVSPQVNLAADIRAAGAGWVVSLTPSDLLAGLTEVLTSDPAELTRRGSAGRALALARFTWPAVAGELAELYRRVARNR